MIRHPHLLTATIANSELRWTSGSGLTQPPQVRFSLGRPGRPALEPTLLIVTADDSGSVIGPAGADPVSNRYEEAWRAFQTIGRRGGKHELGAILHFDIPTSGDIPPTPLTRSGLRRLKAGLTVPREAAGTSCLGPAFNAT